MNGSEKPAESAPETVVVSATPERELEIWRQILEARRELAQDPRLARLPGLPPGLYIAAGVGGRWGRGQI